jgi:hypothetical protein
MANDRRRWAYCSRTDLSQLFLLGGDFRLQPGEFRLGSCVLLGPRLQPIQLRHLRLQTPPILFQPPDVFLQVAQFQPAIGQLVGQLAPLLLQDFALPLPVFGLLDQLSPRSLFLTGRLAPLLIGQRLGMDAGLLDHEDQQDDQRAHRADQHGQEREQRDADLVFS